MGYKMRPLDEMEKSRFLDLIRDPPETELVYAAIAAVALGTGGRISEVLEMRVRDLFDGKGNPLPRISRSIRKVRRNDDERPDPRVTRLFPWALLGDPVIRWHQEAKRRFAVRDGDHLFSLRWDNRPINKVTAWRHQRALLVAAGAPATGIAFHGIRKTTLRGVYKKCIEKTGDGFLAARQTMDLSGHARVDTLMAYLFDDSGDAAEDALLSCFTL